MDNIDVGPILLTALVIVCLIISDSNQRYYELEKIKLQKSAIEVNSNGK